MKAVLLSGGEGTRMRPLTITTPKPLLPVANIPLLSYQFALLKKHNIKQAVVGVGYKRECFAKAASRAARHSGIDFSLSAENKPLGTGGGLRNAYSFFKKSKEPFIALNGDIIADFNLEKILALHREKDALVTIGVVKVSDPSAYGLVVMDSGGNIKRFIEKPKAGDMVADTVNAGVYVFSPGIFDFIPEGKPSSLERDIFPALLEKQAVIGSCIHYGYWTEVGTPEKYMKANFEALAGKTGVFPGVAENGVLSSGNFSPPASLKIEGRLAVGVNTVFGEGVHIKGNVIIGENCFIGKDCLLSDSVILDNTVIRDRCVISGTVSGARVLVDSNCRIKRGVLADGSLIGSFSSIG